MKTKGKTRASVVVWSTMLAIVATTFWLAPAGAASGGAPRIAPPVSEAYGSTLTEWLTVYWRWYWGTAEDPAQSYVGRVKLMPLPVGDWVSGDFSPEDPAVLVGDLNVDLPPGTPIVLPFVALTGERYEDYLGWPDDDPAWFPDTTMSATLTIDGKTVISTANQAAFSVPTTFFDPVVTYPEPTAYGSVAAVWFKGLGMVGAPLPVGVHVIHLEATLIVPGIFGEIFDNTWIVTVSPN